MPAPGDITALILAGGFGTRVKDLLGDLPKPMAPVNGKPFIEWIVRWLKAQGVREVVISTGYGSAHVVNYFIQQPVPEMRVQCVAELEPMGTGGGLAFAAEQSSATPEAWLVLNGDSIIFADIAAVCQSLAEAQGVIVTRAVPDTSRYGSIATDAENRITAFEEKQPGAGHINAGIYLLCHAALADFPATRPLSVEREVFPDLIHQGTGLRAHPVEAPFLDIGTPETLPKAGPFVSENAAQFA